MGDNDRQEDGHTQGVLVRLTPEDHEAYRRACAEVERTMAAQGRHLIREWLGEHRAAA